MPELCDFQALYEAYIDTVNQLERNRKFGQGIFGFKGGPKDDPCHDRFMQDTQALCTAFAGEDHSSEEIREVLAYVYTAPLAYRNRSTIYWMLLAVQGLTAELAEQLAPEDASALFLSFSRDYPRRERMPVQKRLLEVLNRRGGNA